MKKKLLFIIALLFAAASLWAQSTVEVSVARNLTNTGTGGDGYYERDPSLLVAGDGTWYLIYSKSQSSFTKGGNPDDLKYDIYVKTSTDAGLNWSSETMVLDAAAISSTSNFRNATITEADGMIWVIGADVKGLEGDIYANTYSGGSWSGQSMIFNGTYSTGAYHLDAIAEGDDIRLFYGVQNESLGIAFILYHGTTNAWDASCTFIGNSAYYQIPRVCVDGSTYFVVSTNWSNLKLASTTTPGTVPWSAASNIYTAPGGGAACDPSILNYGTSKLIVFHAPGYSDGSQPVEYIYSTNAGATWSSSVPFTKAKYGADVSWDMMPRAYLKDANTIMVFCSMEQRGVNRGQGDICVMEFPVSAIGNKHYTKIQDGIDASSDGWTVRVAAGNYPKETAAGRPHCGSGSDQFGLYIDKDNLTVKGLTASGAEVANASEAAVNITTEATNVDWGPSGVFIDADGVTLEGLKIGDNLFEAGWYDMVEPWGVPEYYDEGVLNSKTIEIMGDDFTMNKCRVEVSTTATPDVYSDESQIYFIDGGCSEIVSYAITNCIFDNVNISINSGAGSTGSESGRIITGNTFNGKATPYLIGFSGWSGPLGGGYPWITDPVGGAVITGNTFSNDETIANFIMAYGNVGGYINSQFDWQEIWEDNTFGNHVITLSDLSTFAVRSFVEGDNNDIRQIGPTIQPAVGIAQNGDYVKVAAGIYNENILVNKELNLLGAGSTLSIIKASAGIAVEVTADNVTIDGFEIKHTAFATLADMGIRLNKSDHSTIQNNKFSSNSLGIQLLDAGYNHIINNELAYSAVGIYIEGTTDGLGNFDGGTNGPFYSLSLHNVIKQNFIHHSVAVGQGIYVDAACESNTFDDNAITDNAAVGYYAWKASNNIITGNTISNNGSEGIQLMGSSGNTITGNTLEDNTSYGFRIRCGVLSSTLNTITGNSITGSVTGILLNDDVSTNNYAGFVSGNIISDNAIYSNTNGLLTQDCPVTEIYHAENNWWGSSTGPLNTTLNPLGIGNAVSDNVSFIPWWCEAAMTSKCAPAGAIVNTSTGEVYTTLADALADVGDEQTLYVAPGTVGGTTFNKTGITVYIDGSGIPGQSKLNGASPALTVIAGEVEVRNGIEFTQTTDEPTILVTGGKLTLRDCIINEYASGNQSCLKVEGGEVDAGTALLPGRNKFAVSGAGSAINNIPTADLYAIGNDWGNPTGPTIYSNPGGTGGAIIGAGEDYVIYEPFGGGPVTTASSVTVCAEATTVDIPITVSQFSGVGSFSLTFGFTPSELETPTIVSRNAAFDLTDHEWGDFEVTTDPDMLADGIYRVSGLGANPDDGITLDPDETLFTLRFTIGTIATTAGLTFEEDIQGTACEFTGVAPSYVPFGDMPTETSYIDGGVIINNLSPNTIAAAQTICELEIPDLLTGSTVAGGDISYQWQISTTSETSGFSNILTDGTSRDYQPVALSVDTWFRRIATSDLNEVPCSSTSNVVKIMVNNLTEGTINGETTICENETTPLTGTHPDHDGVLTYQWQFSENGTDFYNVAAGGTDQDYTTIALTVDTWYQRIATSTTSSPTVACFKISNIIKVTVNNLTAGTIYGTATICSGGTTPLTGTHPDHDGVLTYQWQFSENGTDFDDVAVGGTDQDYTTIALTVDTWYQRIATSTTSSPTVACSKTSYMILITVNARKKISGNFKYYNNALTPLTHSVLVTLTLKTGAGVYPLSTSDNPQTITALGAYEFAGLCPSCTYEIRATSTHLTTGAVNTTDAGQVNYWPTAPYSIENGRFYAGDVVDNNNTLNSSDAQRIQLNFVNGTAFDRTGNWSFWKVGETPIISQVPTPPAQPVPTVTLVVDEDLVQNMYGLCIGDFNCSFNPSLLKAASTTLDLIYAGNRQVSNNQEFDLPVRLVNASQVGAVSLILNFPAALVEVQDVLMNGAGGQLDWAVKGNELRIGWNSQNPLNFAADAEMVTLRLKTTTAFTLGNSIRMTLAADPLNELADARFNVIGDAVLSVDVIDASTVGIEGQTAENGLTLNNRPNPFNSYTMISYTLPFEGNVTLDIRNLLGKIVKTLVNEMQTRGDHSLKFDASSLSPGVYTATIRLSNNSNELIRTIKLVNNNNR